MSTSVFSNNENILNGYSYIFEASDNIENFYFKTFNCPFFEGFTTHRFSDFATLPFHNTRITNDSKYTSLDSPNEVPAENIYKNSVLHGRNSNALENKFMNAYCRDKEKNSDIGHKPIIWRPFSPTPSSQEDKTLENAILKRSSRTNSRNIFYSIKPSNVKIGSSKSSVFKAVKKDTFVCTQCSSRYTSNRQLNSHMRIHTGSKPFRCEYPNCFKSFARNEELTRHKRIHSGFKPHQCITCKKRFGRKDHLSKHLKTHLQTSEKKVYECSFPGCGHRYTRSDALARHKSTAHAIKSQK